MVTVPQVSKAMQTVLIKEANRLGEETDFIQRQCILTGSSFVSGLISGWQNDPQASLSGLSQAVGNAGTPITRQGLAQRFDASSVALSHRLLERSLEVVVKAMPVPDILLERFTSVELVDSSIITLPNSLRQVWQGCGGFGDQARVSALKLNVRWDVKHGHLQHLDISDGKQHDCQSMAHRAPVASGSLRIQDLGYFSLDDLERMSDQDGYFLLRYKRGTGIYDAAGTNRLDLVQLLPQTVGETLDCPIRLGVSKQIPCRLVAEKVPDEVVQQRHERLYEDARQAQRTVSQRALQMAQWTIYITNVPPDLLTVAEVFILGRYRWQIELLFKLWKQDLGIDKWTSQNPHRILSEIYLKLVGAIVTHWLLLVACWHNPRRSLRQAIPTIRGLAWQFANSLHSLVLLRHAFEALCRALATCRMDKSQQHPRAFQFLEGTI